SCGSVSTREYPAPRSSATDAMGTDHARSPPEAPGTWKTSPHFLHRARFPAKPDASVKKCRHRGHGNLSSGSLHGADFGSRGICETSLQTLQRAFLPARLAST